MFDERISGQFAELCADERIWPVGFRIRGKLGYTLWGPKNNEDDIFLVGDGKMLLYSSLGDMIKSLPVQGEHSFSGWDNFQAFLDGAAPALLQPANPEYEVHGNDFDFVAGALAEHGTEIRQFGSAIVDCLDAAYDLAMQLDDSMMFEVLRSHEHPLGRLYYYIWDEVQLPKSDGAAVGSAFDHLISWLNVRASFIEA